MYSHEIIFTAFYECISHKNTQAPIYRGTKFRNCELGTKAIPLVLKNGPSCKEIKIISDLVEGKVLIKPLENKPLNP